VESIIPRSNLYKNGGVIIMPKVIRVEKWLIGNVKVIACNNCTGEVYLQSGWANKCSKCGTEYNGFGQELAPRSQWGYETGERF
jgi:hypothetical protein